MLGALTTYLIILIQFDTANTGGGACGNSTNITRPVVTKSKETDD